MGWGGGERGRRIIYQIATFQFGPGLSLIIFLPVFVRGHPELSSFTSTNKAVVTF